MFLYLRNNGLFIQSRHGTKTNKLYVLCVQRLVIKTKSVEFMPFLLSLSVFLCGTSWFIYGLLEFDPFIVVMN